MTDAPRLEPLPPEAWDDDVRAALRVGFSEAVADRFLSSGADAMRTPNAIGTMLRHPALRSLRAEQATARGADESWPTGAIPGTR